jgi:hypothetical protein
MGVHYDETRDRFTVRWTEDGHRRIRRFVAEPDAIAFDEAVLTRQGRAVTPRHPEEPVPDASADETKRGDDIYSYRTKKGKRWRFVFR